MKKRLISYYMNEKFFVELVSTVGEIKVMIFTAVDRIADFANFGYFCLSYELIKLIY